MERGQGALEDLELTAEFWEDRSVFLTGHTGFKGGWMALWLSRLGARVHGYSLAAPTTPNFFAETNLKERVQSSTVGDVRDLGALKQAMDAAKPSIIMHMAAQSLVRDSYSAPINTFSTNLMGTVNTLEAARNTATVEAIINITTDKCYENQEWTRAYSEDDRLGGYDPYSSSKACAELAAAAYRTSFLCEEGIKLANVRAGNVIGGGDWQGHRLVPDFLRSVDSEETLLIRSPTAVRPWQHVLDPLFGYLVLTEKLVMEGAEYAQAWNFGPSEAECRQVAWIVNHLSHTFPRVRWEVDKSPQPQEAEMLKLDSAKVRGKLGWASRWTLETALDKTAEWHLGWRAQMSMDEVSIRQIEAYEAT